MNKKGFSDLGSLVNLQSPDKVFVEVSRNFKYSYPHDKFIPLRKAFEDFVMLFEGKYPGYRGCTTPYHDIKHSCEVFLAASRIIDGYNIANTENKISSRNAVIMLMAALFHDSGFISEEGAALSDDAKNLLNHEERGVRFIQTYMSGNGFSENETALASRLIEYTDLFSDISAVRCKQDEDHMIGCMLGAADIIGQMAARTYLERLPSLYEEFKDAGVTIYKSEYDLLNRTGEFYESTIKKRLKHDFMGTADFTILHFKERENIDCDVYRMSIENQIDYLKRIIKKYPDSYHDKLKRIDD